MFFGIRVLSLHVAGKELKKTFSRSSQALFKFYSSMNSKQKYILFQATRRCSVYTQDGIHWLPLYRFKWMPIIASISRIKIAQTVLSVIFVPVAYLAYQDKQISLNQLYVLVSICVFALFMLCVMSGIFRRLIGVVSLDESRNVIRIGHLTFWGARRNVEIPLEDLTPLSEVNFRPGDFYAAIRRYSDSKFHLYLPLKVAFYHIYTYYFLVPDAICHRSCMLDFRMCLSLVEVLYNYDSTTSRGHRVHVLAGEKFYLVSDADEHWWFVCKDWSNIDGFYLPKSYLRVLSVQSGILLSDQTSAVISDDDDDDVCSGTSKDEIIRTSVANGHRQFVVAEVEEAEENLPADRWPAMHANGKAEKLSSARLVSASIPVGLEMYCLERADQRSALLNGDHGLVGVETSSSSGRCSTFGTVGAQSRSLDNDLPMSSTCSSSTDSRNNSRNSSSSSVVTAMDSVSVSDALANARSRSPIYANIEECTDMSIPAITPDMQPVRTLSNGWQEYISESGRPFFYHPLIEIASWKPPRSSTSTTNQQCSVASSTRTMLDSSSSSVLDNLSEVVDRRRAVVDDVGLSSLLNKPKNDHCGWSKSKLRTDVDMEPQQHQLQQQQQLQRSGFSIGEEVDDGRGEHCVRVSVRDFSDLNRLLSTSQQHPATRPTSTSLYGQCMSASDGALKFSAFHSSTGTVIKCGNLNRCKVMEAGKRIRKHWSTCFVYLTNAHMIFYKDKKSSEKQGNQYCAPLGVCDLHGAKIKWLVDDKNKRKRLFQLELVDGTAYLFHTEVDNEIIDWYDALQKIVNELPNPGFQRTPVIERSSYKTSSRRVSTTTGQKIAKDAKNLHDYKEKQSTSRNINGPTSDSVEASVPSKQSILEKLVRFFRNRPSVEFLKERGIYKPEPVFGSSLTEICRREKNTVPKFVTVCMSLIEERGLETDGLYRMSGNLSQIQKIRCSVDQEKYNVLMNENDIHVLTGTLKLFFRELQEPLFPPFLMKEFMNAIKLQNAKLRYCAFRDLVARLPPPHHDTLNALLIHLLKVAEKSSTNRMQIHNLAIVFGPTLFSSCPKPEKAESGGQRRKKMMMKKSASKYSEPSTSGHVDVIQSNSHLAFSMIMHGQIVEYMLKEHSKLFKVKRKQLESVLTNVESFHNPKVLLEQYMTTAEVAATMIYMIDNHFNDLQGKVVADLGCGSGMLMIAALLQGADYCVGFDVDFDALQLCKRNVNSLQLTEYADFVQCDCTALFKKQQSNYYFSKAFDTVIMNPPFGTKRNSGVDVEFVKCAINMAKTSVYSMHKTVTREHIMKKAKDWGIVADALAEVQFQLPATYRHHRCPHYTVDVDLIRFSNITAKTFFFVVEDQRLQGVETARIARVVIVVATGVGGQVPVDRLRAEQVGNVVDNFQIAHLQLEVARKMPQPALLVASLGAVP
ncbi:WW domain-containing protein [Trichinella sp. T6]|nr:WW domain-containing protein [Trichinella sp. T6]